jgi:hypothetical protein
VVIAMLLAWRAALTLIGLLSWHVLGPAPPGAELVSSVRLSPHELLALWAHWDSDWYVGIAMNGYTWEQATAFFPLYPALIRLLSVVSGDAVLAGLLISHAGVAVAALSLYRLARLDASAAAATRAVLYLLAFPSSFFLGAVYAESLYLALVLPAMYLARRERWAASALLGGLAALSRPVGVLFLAYWLWEYAASREWAWRRVDATVLWGAAMPGGLALYAAYTWAAFGDPLLFRNAKSYWGETDLDIVARQWSFWAELAQRATAPASWPVVAAALAGIAAAAVAAALLVRRLRLPAPERLCVLAGCAAPALYLSPRLHSAWAFRTMQALDYALLVGCALLSPLVFLRLRASYGVYCAVFLAVTVSTLTLWSMNRYVLMLAPLFILLGRWGERHPLFERAYLAVALPLLGLLTALFTRGHWVA